MTDGELEAILSTIRREHRRTQIIFGICIIILCLVIMFIAPGAIRNAGPDDYGVDGNGDAIIPGSMEGPSASSTPATTTNP